MNVSSWFASSGSSNIALIGINFGKAIPNSRVTFTSGSALSEARAIEMHESAMTQFIRKLLTKTTK